MTYRALFFSFLVAASGCAIADTDEGNGKIQVIGGQPEKGYAAAGFLTYEGQPFCGASLLSPTVAVTAAHCVDISGAYAVGLGTADESPLFPVEKVISHPGWERGDFVDVALLMLEEPAPFDEEFGDGFTLTDTFEVSRAETECDYRYVGYGRTTPGAADVQEGYTFERKGFSACIETVEGHDLHTRGNDGGNCFGDSGGPMLREGTNQIVGVTSRVTMAPNSDEICSVSNLVIFQSLEEVSGWIKEQMNLHGSCLPGTQLPCNDCGVSMCGADGQWGACWAQGSCPDGEVCRQQGTCVEGVCIADTDCPGDEVCNQDNMCVPGPDSGCNQTCTDAWGDPVCAGETGFERCSSSHVRECTCQEDGSFTNCSLCMP